MARSNFAEVATRATPRRTNRWQNEWKPLRCLTQNQFNFGFRDKPAAQTLITKTQPTNLTSRRRLVNEGETLGPLLLTVFKRIEIGVHFSSSPSRPSVTGEISCLRSSSRMSSGSNGPSTSPFCRRKRELLSEWWSSFMREWVDLRFAFGFLLGQGFRVNLFQTSFEHSPTGDFCLLDT
jgi:hypothetical protein